MSTLFTTLESFDDTQTDIQENPGVEFEGSIEPLDEQMDEANEIAHDLEVESHAQALDEESIQRTETALEGLESLYGTLQASLAKGGISPESSVILTNALEGHAATMGVTFKSYLLPATESYTDAGVESTTAALEGIGDTIKAGAKTVWEMIQKAIKWLGEQVSKIGNLFKSQDKAAEQMVKLLENKIKTEGDVDVELSKADKEVVETIAEDMKAAESASLELLRWATDENEEMSLEKRQKLHEIMKRVRERKVNYERSQDEVKEKTRLSKLLAALKEFLKFKSTRAKISELGDKIKDTFNKLMNKAKNAPAAESEEGLPAPVVNEEDSEQRGLISKIVTSLMGAYRGLASFVSGVCSRFLNVFKRNKNIFKVEILDKNGNRVGSTSASLVSA